MRNAVIGIVPAAGKASRLSHCMCSKELLPVGETNGGRAQRPKAISEYLVDAMVAAGADKVCVVIAPNKQDIVRFYGSGAHHGVAIAYVCQETPTGMADAIDLAYPWLRDATVLMGMPDTIVKPADSLAKLRVFYARENADLALAVAPTEEPERLGPVSFDATGRVFEVLDKPDSPPHNKVWTVACWGPTFTDYLHSYLSARSQEDGEITLGAVFQAAVREGMRVQALPFDDGKYIDAGTMEGWRAAQREVASSAMTPTSM